MYLLSMFFMKCNDNNNNNNDDDDNNKNKQLQRMYVPRHYCLNWFHKYNLRIMYIQTTCISSDYVHNICKVSKKSA